MLSKVKGNPQAAAASQLAVRPLLAVLGGLEQQHRLAVTPSNSRQSDDPGSFLARWDAAGAG